VAARRALIALALAILIPERKRVRERALRSCACPHAAHGLAGGPAKAAVAAVAYPDVAVLICIRGRRRESMRNQQVNSKMLTKSFQETLKSHPQSRRGRELQFDQARRLKLKDYNKALESFSQALLTPDTVCRQGSLQSRQHPLSTRRDAENRRQETQRLTNASIITSTLKLDRKTKKRRRTTNTSKEDDELKNKKNSNNLRFPDTTQKNITEQARSAQKQQNNRTRPAATTERSAAEGSTAATQQQQQQHSSSSNNRKPKPNQQDQKDQQQAQNQQSQNKSGSDQRQKRTTAKRPVSGKNERRRNSSNSPARVHLPRPARKKQRTIRLRLRRAQRQAEQSPVRAKGENESLRRHWRRRGRKRLPYPGGIAAKEFAGEVKRR